jgi:hypothetical protein
MTEETNKNEEIENTEAEATTEAPTSTPAPAEGQPGAGQAAGLTIGDLRLMARLVQVSSERGAIRADEMATVGDLYNRLSNFLNTVAPQPTQPTAPTTADGTAPGTTDAPAETNEESDTGTEGTEGSQGE